MKFKAVALVAICASVAAPNVFAADFTPARAAAAVTNNKVFFSTGASASIQLVYQAFDELCDATDGKSAFTAATIANNTNVSPGDSSPSWGNFGAYGCKFKPAAGLPATLASWAGADVVYMATVDGGSFNAIQGQSANVAAQLNFISEAFTGCTNNGTSVTIKGAQVYDLCATAKNTKENGKSGGGAMDHDKANFRAVATLQNALFNDVLSIYNASTSIKTDTAQLFGVAVSDTLYREMQTAQGLDPVCLGVKSVACQPNITKRQYSAIVNDDGGLGLISSTGTQPLTGAVNKLGLCRRVVTSGTQVGSDIFFLNACSTGSAQGAKTAKRASDFGCAFGGAATDPYDTGSFECVVENSSTGNVKSCLNASTLTNSTRTIGVMSLENFPTGADTWYWVKLDGVAPQEGVTQAQNGSNGKYDYAFEQVMITNPTNTPGVSGTAADKTTRLALQQYIAGRFNDAAFIVNAKGMFLTGGSVGVRGGSPSNSCAAWTF